jgi:hypothetical protein
LDCKGINTIPQKHNKTINEKSMELETHRVKALPTFERQAIFAEVDKSNVRFEDYTKQQRLVFATEARAQKTGALSSHEARRVRH